MGARRRHRYGVYDNEAALAARHGGRAKPTEAFDRFRGVLGRGPGSASPATQRPRPRRASEPLPGDQLPARPRRRRCRRLQRRARELADQGEPATAPRVALPPGGSDRPRTAGRWPSRRCCRIRRCGSRPGSPATTTCASDTATTMCTPRRSGGGWRSASTSMRSWWFSVARPSPATHDRWPARQRQDPPRHRPVHPGLPSRPPRRVRHRRRMGRPNASFAAVVLAGGDLSRQPSTTSMRHDHRKRKDPTGQPTTPKEGQ
jgi:hypothetical protein